MVKGLYVFRVTLASLMFLLFGAVSTVPIWVSISVTGRSLLLVVLFAVTLHSTWKISPLYSQASRITFFLMHFLLLIAFSSAVWSIDRRETLITVMGIALLLLTVQLCSTRRWRDLPTLVGDLKVLVWVSSLVLGVGLLAHLVGFATTGHGGRLQGLLNNPNIAALAGALTFFIGLGLYKRDSSFISTLILVPPLLTVFLTQTRTTLIALILAFIWILMRVGMKGVIISLGVGILIAVAVKTVGIGLFERVLSRFAEGAAENDGLSGRTSRWEAGLGQIESMPFGVGWGTNAAIVTELGGVNNYHNSYIQIAVEGGVIAAAVVILIYLTLICALVRVPKTILGLGVSAAFIAGVVIQFTESAIFGIGQPFPYLFWLVVGALLSLTTGSENQCPPEKVPTDHKHSAGALVYS